MVPEEGAILQVVSLVEGDSYRQDIPIVPPQIACPSYYDVTFWGDLQHGRMWTGKDGKIGVLRNGTVCLTSSRETAKRSLSRCGEVSSWQG